MYDVMKFFMGLVLGTGIGIVIGLLLAPQPGEATRAQLSEGNIAFLPATLSDEIRSRASSALAQGREVYKRAKAELSERYSQAKSGNL
jgi:gas vesicle protein